MKGTRLKNLIETFVNILSHFDRRTPTRTVYLATATALLYAGLSRRQLISRHEKVVKTELLSKLPPLLRAYVRPHGQLYRVSLDIVDVVDRIISNRLAVELIGGRADLNFVRKVLIKELGRVSYVLLYDCLSIPEFLTIATSLKARGYEATFSPTCFLNPLGLTRFITEQAYSSRARATMKDVLKTLTDALGAIGGELIREVDEKVHEYGQLGIGALADNVNIDMIISKCETYARRGVTLVASDHGYDVISNTTHILITHGAREEQQSYKVILNFSKIAPFMAVSRRPSPQ